MWYPVQTSFIPITVALAKFIESNGFGGLYPYWYLGTTPVKYLTGPIVPAVLIGLHKILPQFSLFDLAYLLLTTSYLLQALGWGLLAWKLSGKRIVGWWVGGLTLILPWHWISGFGLGEASAVLAGAMTPWVLLAFARISNFQFPISNLLLSAAAFAFLLLTNTTAAIPVIIGTTLLSVLGFQFSDSGQSVIQLTGQQKTEKLKSENRQLRTDNLEVRLKRAILVILLGWVLATIWYGPNYWLTVFGAPSIGGKSVLGAFVTLLNLLRGFVPVILAVVLLFWKVKPRDLYDKFVLAWLTIFGSLTLFRFMADPDFWMDWTSWVGEVEMGAVLLMAKLVQNSKFKIQSSRISIYYLLFTIYFLSGWFLAWQYRDFWLPMRSTENTVEYKIANWFSDNLTIQQFNNSTIFLSGSTAFWLNALVDVKQVRGGRDEASVDQNWRKLNWQVTQGNNLTDAVVSLKAQGVDFIVVHGNSSQEYYHDFVDPEKFEKIPSLEKLYDRTGDVIYRVK